MADRAPFALMDDYLQSLPDAERAALDRVRAIVGTLLGFRTAKHHLSLFPFSPAAIEAVADRLAGFDVAKGTIRFTPDHPVPDDVFADLLRARLREVSST